MVRSTEVQWVNISNLIQISSSVNKHTDDEDSGGDFVNYNMYVQYINKPHEQLFRGNHLVKVAEPQANNASQYRV